MTTNAQRAKVPFWPKLFKKIWAIGCGLFNRLSISVPMQNANDTLIAKCANDTHQPTIF